MVFSEVTVEPSEIDLTAAVSWAARFFPGPGDVAAEPLPGDASPRRYVRLRRGAGSRLLLVGPDREENRRWLFLGRQLWYHGLALPRVPRADLEAGWFLVEDLGTARLDSLWEGGADPVALRDAYASVMTALADWHTRALGAAGGFASLNPAYEPDFVFKWEWGYLLDGLARLGLPEALEPGPGLLREAGELCAAACLNASPRVLIHRDFQSRNLMVVPGGVVIIDWQGARLGPAAYDLASLLYDPYVPADDEFRLFCLGAYLRALERSGGVAAVLGERADADASAPGPGSPEGLLEAMRPAAVARLMQASGAYLSLWLVRGRPAYRAHLPVSLGRAAALLRGPVPPGGPSGRPPNPSADLPLLGGLLAKAALLAEEKCRL
ncbi:MAG: phosphotransferase [Deltaproteobacteria bacterium]|nr:phosphotransferase [Deltaproteobacteria bacterium]